MADVRCSIQLASRKSGLSTHLIRMWQKRYGAVSPQRTETNRRLYSEAEIERLRLLRGAVEAGHRIGDVARLPDEDLRRLVPTEPQAAPRRNDASPDRPPSAAAPAAEEVIAQAVAATRDMDAPHLQRLMAEASAVFGFRGSLDTFFAPFVHRLGELWRDGTLTAAHEHFASAAIRTFLLGSPRTFAVGGQPPAVVVVTPTGQLHEIGAVLAAAVAGDLGWRVIFLGSSLPAAEIAGAVRQHSARAVALSLVYPPDDPQIPRELQMLRRALPAEVEVIVGGRAAPAYTEALHEVGAQRVSSLREFEDALEALRARPGTPAAD